MWKASQGIDPPILTAAGLGTGSDYGPFLHHAGIPVLDISMGSLTGNASGIYHTQYDSFYWMTHFTDPNFYNHAAIAKLVGILVMNLADTAVLPYSFTEYSTQLQYYINGMRSGPGGNLVNWLPLTNAVSLLTDIASEITIEKNDDTLIRDVNTLKLRCLNDRLFQAERGFLYLQGIPGREWYRHIVWVTSEYDAYGSSAFGTIGDALASNNSVEAQNQIGLVSVLVRQAVEYLTPPTYLT